MDAACTGQYLTFTLSGALYAAAIRDVHEVIEFTGLTEIPLAPRAVPGVINLRGAVVPVVDLSVRLGGPRAQPGPKSCIVIVGLSAEAETGLAKLGLLVDGVEAALDASDEQREPKPLFGVGIRPDFVAELLKLETGFIPVLELSRVLLLDELDGSADPDGRAAQTALSA